MAVTLKAQRLYYRWLWHFNEALILSTNDTIDEFFKTMKRGMELSPIAHRAGSDARKATTDKLKADGKDADVY